jgi:hypothetical protein
LSPSVPHLLLWPGAGIPRIALIVPHCPSFWSTTAGSLSVSDESG